MKAISSLKKLIRATCPFAPKLNLKLSPADYIFATQYFKNGGAERVIINYISALQEIHPNLKISIITTDPDDGSTWHAGVPKNVQFINLSPLVASLPRYLRTRLLAKIINQLSPRTLHVVNSKAALDLVAGLDQTSPPLRAYVSIFNSDFSASGHLRTYYKELAAAADNVTRIFTDNATVIAEATKATGLPKTLFRVHYQPIRAQVQTPHILSKTGKIRILWASRVTFQKRPDILCRIAEKLPPDDFEVAVYGTLDPGYTQSDFDNILSLRYHGAFKTFSNIPTENYDIFLYTSQADGLPNVLFEVTAAGLPVIAPDVGGVNEFIKADTGFLVKDFSDTDAYVSVLTALAKTRPNLRPKVLLAQSLLTSRHSFTEFTSIVKNDIIAQ